MTVIRFPSRNRQQPGEHLRELRTLPGVVEIVTTCPDGTRITERLTPEQAAEWSDDLRDAAADALSRGGARG